MIGVGDDGGVAERFADDDEERLLDGEVPPAPPAVLGPDGVATVGVWREGDLGALMSISRDPEAEEEPYSVDVDTFERTKDGWRWMAGGGSDWPTDYGTRPSAGHPALTGIAHGIPDGRMLWTGLAPANIHRVCIEVEGATLTVDIEPFTGAFLVALRYPPPESTAIGACD